MKRRFTLDEKSLLLFVFSRMDSNIQLTTEFLSRNTDESIHHRLQIRTNTCYEARDGDAFCVDASKFFPSLLIFCLNKRKYINNCVIKVCSSTLHRQQRIKADDEERKKKDFFSKELCHRFSVDSSDLVAEEN